ncbi:hypothetical protein ONS95_008412 [Cadophora gregata]|uniref:uncharacterized protein n=1 Tax=Cadophora gregata TaxID=51156 RepID=UPI0026DCC950|nr:uncharacterized protein ONS95_008412 [Cadophora gregata]KAK0126833.1 hypothetical protein ONS95_008412 [Cadophora gregata]
MRSSKFNVMILITFLILLLTTTLAAPAGDSAILDLTAEEISNLTTVPTYPNPYLGGRDDNDIAAVQGNPETGEWFKPEPKVSFQSCKPRQDVHQMCTLAYARRVNDNAVKFVAYDHNCYRLGEWTRNIDELHREVNGEKHGTDLVTSKLKWNILLWMGEDWQGAPARNYNLKIYYSWYVSFPFYWRDRPEDWRSSNRVQSSVWKGVFYDFFRIPFNCGDEYP